MVVLVVVAAGQHRSAGISCALALQQPGRQAKFNSMHVHGNTWRATNTGSSPMSPAARQQQLQRSDQVLVLPNSETYAVSN